MRDSREPGTRPGAEAVRRGSLWLVIMISHAVFGMVLAQGLVGATLELVFPLGGDATSYAAKDDRVPIRVRTVLSAERLEIVRGGMGGGVVALAYSPSHDAYVIGLARVRPGQGELDGERLDVHLLLECSDGITAIARFHEDYFTDELGDGWANSAYLGSHPGCSHVILAVKGTGGETLRYLRLPLAGHAREQV